MYVVNRIHILAAKGLDLNRSNAALITFVITKYGDMQRGLIKFLGQGSRGV